VAYYVEEVCKRVKQVDQTQRTMVCVGPSHREAWEGTASAPNLDVFGVDPYWLWPPMKLTKEDACEAARQLRDVCREKAKSSQIWLGCFRTPAGLEEDIYVGGKMLAEVGCDSLYTWGFRCELGTCEEGENWEKAWNSVVRLYREVSRAQGGA
jgi:hypothetical protein